MTDPVLRPALRCVAIAALCSATLAPAARGGQPGHGSLVIHADGSFTAAAGRLEAKCWEDLCSFFRIPVGSYELEMRQKGKRLFAAVEVLSDAQSRVRIDFSTAAMLVHVPEAETIGPQYSGSRSISHLDLRPLEWSSTGFQAKRPFRLWAVASWVGTAEKVTVLVRGPAGGGEGPQHDVYATRTGSSPVRLELEITNEMLARGDRFRLEAFVASKKGETFGSLRTNAP